ncbi:hypothetical protein N8844_03870 [Planktomarina temperata]|nr:hypothetical protein [Planktomarina temperata]
MKHLVIGKFSIYLLLLAAYNPFTTFIFNKTGFHGAILHQSLMFSGWIAFIMINIKFAIRVVNYQLFITLFLILSYCAFSLINGSQYGNMNGSIADIAYFIELWMFYVAALISVKFHSIADILKTYRNVLIINGLGVVIIYVLLKSELYFTLQLGPIRVSRALDFLIISGLLIVLYGSRHKRPNRLVYFLLLTLFVFANALGFSRGVWLALIIIIILDISIRTGYKFYRLRIAFKPVNIVILPSVILALALLQAYFPIFNLVVARLMDLDYDTASIGGRITAYSSLFIESFSDFGILLAGKGAGAYMPGLHIPASSSPSFLGTILYVHGFVIFSLFCCILIMLAYRLAGISFTSHGQFGRFPIYNLIAHFIILNIFPSVSHFPILGFVVFVSFAMLKAKGER